MSKSQWKHLQRDELSFVEQPILFNFIFLLHKHGCLTQGCQWLHRGSQACGEMKYFLRVLKLEILIGHFFVVEDRFLVDGQSLKDGQLTTYQILIASHPGTRVTYASWRCKLPFRTKYILYSTPSSHVHHATNHFPYVLKMKAVYGVETSFKIEFWIIVILPECFYNYSIYNQVYSKNNELSVTPSQKN